MGKAVALGGKGPPVGGMNMILLVRHASHAELGKVLSGRSELSLDAEGLAQAEALVFRLRGREIASLHSSPRHRALQTIAPLAGHRDLPVRRTAALDEIDFGAFTGRSFAELDPVAAWQRWNGERATARCPGGETMSEAVARARRYLLALPASAKPAVCVTHCDIIRGLCAEAMGIGLAGLLSLECDPCSITALAVANGRLECVP